MTKRRVLLGAFTLVGLVVLALLIPGSPVYLPDLLRPKGMHDGHSTRYWIKALDSPDRDTRRDALFALGAIGPEAAESVPRLADILDNDPDGGCRTEASLALGKIGPAAQPAVPALTRALKDDFLLVRMNALQALRRLGTEAHSAVPALIEALKDDQNRTNLGMFHITIQESAAVTLGRVSAGSDEGVAALAAILKGDSTSGLRRAAARGLGEVGAEARPAVPLLRRLLDDKDAEVRRAAEEALRQIGAPAGAKAAANTSSLAEELTLSPVERQYLWEIEHHGNLLVKYGFGPLARALRDADASALSRLLADDFQGADLNRPQRINRTLDLPGGGQAFVERLQDAGRPPLQRDRTALVARLLEFRHLFGARPPQVKLALMALAPVRRGHLDGLWQGTAQLRLHGEHPPGAPVEVVAQVRYQLPRPTRKTLGGPGWLRSLEVQEVLTARAPRYLFAEVARQRGLDPSQLHDNWKGEFVPSPGGVYVCDFDGDGWLDVLLTDVRGCALYRGRPGGTFEDVTERCGLPRSPGMRPAAAWADLDGDGYPDLLLAGRVYRNEGGKRFVDYTDRCNLHLPTDALNIVVADYDRDGRLDLYVTRSGRPGHSSWLNGKSDDPVGNYLFRNKGGWRFEDVSRASGTRCPRGSAFTAAWLDANNDGWPDLHVINEFGDGVLLINNKDGTFSRHALADHPADFGSMGLVVGDVDNDGNIDIYCGNMYSKAGARVIGNLGDAAGAYPPAVLEKMRRFVAGSQLHLNRGVRKRHGVRSVQFEQAGLKRRVAAVGWAYGAALADLDNDGWLDLYATAGYVSRSRDKPDG